MKRTLQRRLHDRQVSTAKKPLPLFTPQANIHAFCDTAGDGYAH